MSYLLFPTKMLADSAQSKISQNMDMPYTLPNGYMAERWAEPVQVVGGWAFVKPPEGMMAGVIGAVVVDIVEALL